MGEFWRLVGATLLGALISFGTTFYFERRKERRAEKAEQREHGRQLRQAARVVREELGNIHYSIDVSLDQGQWWSNPPQDIPTPLWAQYRAVLAAHLEDNDIWSDVSIAYTYVERFNAWLSMSRGGDAVFHPFLDNELDPIRGTTITKSWRDELNSLVSDISRASRCLDPFAKSAPEDAQKNV